jgi:prevent-host-death family protein
MATVSKKTEVTFDGSEITAKDLKAHLSDSLGRVQFGGEQLVVTKNGKAAAAIIPIEMLMALRALEDANDIAAAKAARAEAKTHGTLSLDDVRASIGL